MRSTDLAALVAEADRIAQIKDDQRGTAMIAAEALVPRLAAALRPYLAPVGLEAFEGLRWPQTFTADEAPRAAEVFNARVDALRAAHAAALAEVEGLRRVVEAANERLGMARHFIVSPPPVTAVPAPTGSDMPATLEVNRIEIGASGNDGLFRVVAMTGDGPFAELLSPMLGKDGAWHHRPDEETAAFSELTGFPDADAAFAALAAHRARGGGQ